MGKRTIRILKKDIPNHLDSLPGKEAHVVGRDGITYFGTVESANRNEVVIRDGNSAWYNRKKHRHILPIASIYEIILDLVSDY